MCLCGQHNMLRHAHNVHCFGADCRVCLVCLKHGNPSNGAAVLAALRACPRLACDYWALKDAMQLLDEMPPQSLLPHTAQCKAVNRTCPNLKHRCKGGVGQRCSNTSSVMVRTTAHTAAHKCACAGTCTCLSTCMLRARADAILRRSEAAAAEAAARELEEEMLQRKLRYELLCCVTAVLLLCPPCDSIPLWVLYLLLGFGTVTVAGTLAAQALCITIARTGS
jgi:hypothetical protein